MPLRRKRPGPLYPTDLLQSPLYSRTCKEAFRVMERLAAAALRRPGSDRKFDDLAFEAGLPVPALDQVVHFLRLAGLVDRRGGNSGGIRLARAASRISLLDVVRAIDGTGLWGRCILGLEECSDEMPCPAHPAWKEARSLLEKHLAGQTVADLTEAVTRRRLARKSSEAADGDGPDT